MLSDNGLIWYSVVVKKCHKQDYVTGLLTGFESPLQIAPRIFPFCRGSKKCYLASNRCPPIFTLALYVSFKQIYIDLSRLSTVKQFSRYLDDMLGLSLTTKRNYLKPARHLFTLLNFLLTCYSYVTLFHLSKQEVTVVLS